MTKRPKKKLYALRTAAYREMRQRAVRAEKRNFELADENTKLKNRVDFLDQPKKEPTGHIRWVYAKEPGDSVKLQMLWKIVGKDYRKHDWFDVPISDPDENTLYEWIK